MNILNFDYSYIMKKNCYVYFHQGYTDIINCLPLVKYYHKLYDENYTIKLIVREDVKQLIDYFLSDTPNIETIYINKKILDTNKITELININNNDLTMFHGLHDIHRQPSIVIKSNKNMRDLYFLELFYKKYDIDYNVRITHFIFKRDINIENEQYDNFILKHGKDYMLYHDNEPRSYKFDTNYKSINLNMISNLMFDYIKIIENAKELHLLDSVWGAFCYILDAKYGLFKHINVYLHVRSYAKMFKSPVLLSNWTILE